MSTKEQADQALAAGAEDFRRRRMEPPAAKEPRKWTGPGWLSPSAPAAIMANPLDYARALTAPPLVEEITGSDGVPVPKVTLTLGPRDVVGGAFSGGRSPGGQITFWRAQCAQISHLTTGDQITVEPLSPHRNPSPWLDLREYQLRVNAGPVWWLSVPPP
jgi:hypothetical protein